MKKFHLMFMLIAMVLVLAACNQKPKQNNNSTAGSSMSMSLPNTFMALGTIDETNLVVTVDDGSTTKPCTGLVVTGTTYSCTATLTVGSHTLTLINSINDVDFGIVPVTFITGITVNIVVNQDTVASIPAGSLQYQDDNGDGITNLDELIAGTDPFISSNWDQLVWDTGEWK